VAERKEIDTVLGRVSTIRIEPALFGDNEWRSAPKAAYQSDHRSPTSSVPAQLKSKCGTFDIKLLAK
jgi:hypothetical protein